jgi:RNA polymerase sigma factor (sigma-70 family)
MTADIDQLLSTAQRAALVRLCTTVSGSSGAAEDLVQETLLEAWRHRHKLTDPAGADRWLAAVARNVCRRWHRRQAVEASRVVPDGCAPKDGDAGAQQDAEADRVEMRALLRPALSALPSTTREVLIHRYVHDASYAEVGNRLGLSAEATAMRASRGKAALRLALEPHLREPEHAERPTVEAVTTGWAATSVWCTSCGRSTLVMRHDVAARAVSFRCERCSTDPGDLSHHYRLDAPVLSRVLGDLSRPVVAMGRAREWAWQYFQGGAERGQVACTRCGRQIPLRSFVPGQGRDGGSGLYAACPACRHDVCTSTQGMAMASPAARRFLGEHPRARIVNTRATRHCGVPASRVALSGSSAQDRLDLIFAASNLRLLEVRQATPANA